MTLPRGQLSCGGDSVKSFWQCGTQNWPALQTGFMSDVKERDREITSRFLARGTERRESLIY